MLNYLIREDVLGSRSIAPPFLTSAVDRSRGQLRNPAALLQGKHAPVPIG
jgi:hypothetical protein